MQRQNLKAGKILYVGLYKPIFIAFISINFTERKSRMEKPWRDYIWRHKMD